MVRFGLFPVVLASVLSFSLCAPLQAQTAAEEASPARVQDMPTPADVSSMPLSTGAASQRPGFLIEFRSPAQMTERDRELAANTEASIGERAGFSGFIFEGGGWSYRQIVCPALPNHLFLQYTRNSGAGDVTVFSASIPRGGEGQVRIIPILRRGYSLFSPAPINALTISAFNHIRAEEGAEKSSDWVGTGLCYAALAGAHPRIAAPDADPSTQKVTPALTAILEIPVRGGQIIRFTDAAATPRPMEWTMTFTPQGKLIKATHAPAAMVTGRPVPQNPEVLKSWPVPQDKQN